MTPSEWKPLPAALVQGVDDPCELLVGGAELLGQRLGVVAELAENGREVGLVGRRCGR